MGAKVIYRDKKAIKENLCPFAYRMCNRLAGTECPHRPDAESWEDWVKKAEELGNQCTSLRDTLTREDYRAKGYVTTTRSGF